MISAPIKYLTADHLGSPRIITDQTGAVTDRKDFMAFGEEATASGTSGLGYTTATEPRQDYTGYEKDAESGLEFAQARYFNQTHGRYTSVDPLTSSATIRDPQTFNRYSYALNSPFKFTDPLGLMAEGVPWQCHGCSAYGGGGAFSSVSDGVSLFDEISGGYSPGNSNAATHEEGAMADHQVQSPVGAPPPPIDSSLLGSQEYQNSMPELASFDVSTVDTGFHFGSPIFLSTRDYFPQVWSKGELLLKQVLLFSSPNHRGTLTQINMITVNGTSVTIDRGPVTSSLLRF